MTASTQIATHVLDALDGMLKPASGELKHPYVSPGGVYAQTLWDWDSYWTLVALFGIARRLRRPEVITQLTPYARGVFFNFLEHQGEDGSLPILITPEDDDMFDCTRSPDHNMAKPFIAQLALLLLEHGLLQKDDLVEQIYAIRAFHQCYDQRYRHAGTGLVVWAKDWGIGVDDDPTAWGRPDKSCASLYLNCFLHRDLLAAAELSDRVGRPDYAADYRARAEQLAEAMQTYCWDQREKAFFSVDVQCRQNVSPHRVWGKLNFKLDPFWQVLKLKVLSWNCLLPFWTGIGTQAQLDAFVAENLVPERLLSRYGVRSLSADEPMYAPEVVRGNPSNWLGPIWGIANYISWTALSKGGHGELAETIATAFTGLLADDLSNSGCLHEYYSPETGRPIATPGFISWNALAALSEEAGEATTPHTSE